MVVVTRFTVAEGEAAGFQKQAAEALTALAERPGFVAGRACRAMDEPTAWLLITEWESVGAWRRALGGFDVKMKATPLLARSHDEPSAFEDLVVTVAGGQVEVVSDRAADADTVGIGEAAGPSVLAE
ncbi:MAG TPA: antibiotic biosynthesis monooxygenase family protein [Mycobacteriales bacterium]|nr:antibiotic biosynthesis monooxygenase family protein [Mycobacteriales bacterium]